MISLIAHLLSQSKVYPRIAWLKTYLMNELHPTEHLLSLLLLLLFVDNKIQMTMKPEQI